MFVSTSAGAFADVTETHNVWQPPILRELFAVYPVGYVLFVEATILTVLPLPATR